MNLFSLYNFYPKYKSKMLKASMYSVLNKIFDLFPPLLIGLAVDVVVLKNKSLLGNLFSIDQETQLYLVAFLTVLIWILESFFEFLFQKNWRYLAQEYQHDLRLKTYNHYQSLDQGYLEKQRTGNLMAILNDDVNQLEQFLNIGINDILQLMVTVLGIGGYFFYINSTLATFAFCVIPLIVYGSIWYQKFLAKRYEKVRNEVGVLNSELNNNIQGITTIKAFTKEQEELKRIEKISTHYMKANEEAIIYSSLFTPLIRMLIMAAFITTLLYGGNLVLNDQMAIGAYSTLVFLIQRLLWPLTRLGDVLNLYQKSMASFERIQSLLKVDYHITDGSKTITSQEIQSISFNNVSFQYMENQQILKNISFTVSKGCSLAIVGATGSGKSTIIKLLLRLYEVETGEIKINETPIKELKIKDLRKQIAWVSQEVYLFRDTFINNLKYGKPTATKSEIDYALRLSTADKIIDLLPDGENTVLGERGETLSGGQRQRLSLARAILSDRPIIILDEATSAIDNVTSKIIEKNLSDFLSKKITITIAHRLSSIINSDQILVIDNGQIIESGKHSELLDQNGLYSGLWNIQSGKKHQS